MHAGQISPSLTIKSEGDAKKSKIKENRFTGSLNGHLVSGFATFYNDKLSELTSSAREEALKEKIFYNLRVLASITTDTCGLRFKKDGQIKEEGSTRIARSMRASVWGSSSGTSDHIDNLLVFARYVRKYFFNVRPEDPIAKELQVSLDNAIHGLDSLFTAPIYSNKPENREKINKSINKLSKLKTSITINDKIVRKRNYKAFQKAGLSTWQNTLETIVKYVKFIKPRCHTDSECFEKIEEISKDLILFNMLPEFENLYKFLMSSNFLKPYAFDFLACVIWELEDDNKENINNFCQTLYKEQSESELFQLTKEEEKWLKAYLSIFLRYEKQKSSSVIEEQNGHIEELKNKFYERIQSTKTGKAVTAAHYISIYVPNFKIFLPSLIERKITNVESLCEMLLAEEKITANDVSLLKDDLELILKAIQGEDRNIFDIVKKVIESARGEGEGDFPNILSEDGKEKEEDKTTKIN